MKQEHLTPDGWKPCTASAKECKYEERRITNASAFIDSAVQDVQAGKPNAIKDFFNTLFGSKKIPEDPASTNKLPEADTPSVLPANNVPVGKVIRGVDGRFEVLCEDKWGKRMIVHKFGDLITDEATAERLHNADLEKDYQLGECGVLAGELWNRSEHVEEYYMFKTKSDPMFGTHHFVQLKDGTYADSLGVWTEEAFFSYWKDVDPTIQKSLFEAEEAPLTKNPNFTVSNPALFEAVVDVINKRMSKE